MEGTEQDMYTEEGAVQTERPDYFQKSLSLQPTPVKPAPSLLPLSKTPVSTCKGSSSGGRGVMLVGTPLTPTANLKVLMSAVSPALREKERQERQQQGEWVASSGGGGTGAGGERCLQQEEDLCRWSEYSGTSQ